MSEQEIEKRISALAKVLPTAWDEWGNILVARVYEEGMEMNADYALSEVRGKGEIAEAYKEYEELIKKRLLEEGVSKSIEQIIQEDENVENQISVDEINEALSSELSEEFEEGMVWVDEEVVGIEGVIGMEEQKEKTILSQIEMSDYKGMDELKAEEKIIIENFFREYSVKDKAKDKVKEIREFWGEGKKANEGKDFRRIVRDQMLREEKLFPDALNLNTKTEIAKQNILPEDFNNFKSVMLKRKIRTQLTRKNTFSSDAMRILSEEIKEVNKLSKENKNILDYIYEIKFRRGDTSKEIAKEELNTMYKTLISEGVDIKAEDNKEKINEKINEYFLIWPQRYKILGQKNQAKNIVKKYIEIPIKEKYDSSMKYQREVLAALRLLNEKELNELNIDKNVVDEINESLKIKSNNVVETKYKNEEAIDEMKYYFITRDRVKLNEEGFDLDNVKDNRTKFNELYEKYTVFNKVFEERNEDGKKRSFLIDMVQKINERASMKDVAIKSIAFINKNFPDVLSDQEYVQKLEYVKENGKLDSENLSFIADLEIQIYEKYDDMSRNKEQGLFEMTKLNFIEMKEYNEALMVKDSLEIHQDFEKIKLDKRHFVTEVIELMDSDKENFYKKSKIEDKNIQKNFEKYCEDFIKSTGGKPEESKIEEFIEYFISIKAEGENNNSFKNLFENFETMSKERKIEGLVSMAKKYEHITKVGERGNANIVEDYLKNVDPTEKRKVVEQLLYSMGVQDVPTALIGIQFDKGAGEYNEKLASLVNDYCKKEKNLRSLMGHLSGTKAKDQSQSQSSSKRYTITELNNGYSEELNTEIKEMKDIEIANEEEYNVRGLSLIDNDGFSFQMGYNNILKKYNEGVYTKNKELDELIGLRLAMGMSTEKFGDVDVEGINFKPLIAQEEEVIMKELQEDESFSQEVNEYINKKNKNTQEQISEEERKEVIKKLIAGEMTLQRYKEIISKIYVEKKRVFLQKNHNYLESVKSQALLKHSIRDLRKEADSEEKINKVKEKISIRNEEIGKHEYKAMIEEEEIGEIKEEGMKKDLSKENKVDYAVLKELINQIINNDLTEEQKLQIQDELENMQIRADNMIEQNQNPETEENKTKERIKELVGDKIDKVKIEELMQAYKNKRKYEKTSDKEKSNSKTI